MDATEAPEYQVSESKVARGHGRRLLSWYDRHRRDLPWRAPPGQVPDPYRVWLSEIMLQQTTVAAVIPYFERFTRRWPDIRALAAADLDEILVEWQGLGYYARARNLVKCARVIAGDHGGVFPETVAELIALPGIGPYTAAAIAAIAFDAPEVVVDGNVERVVARLFAVAEPLPGVKPELRRLAGVLNAKRRAGDYAQAMMDLGATVCTPRAPDCRACPLTAVCRAFALGDETGYPRRQAGKRRPTRRAIAWFAVNERGEVLLRRRPEKGLLGGMMEVPSSPWKEGGKTESRLSGSKDGWRVATRPVVHVFTHFRLELDVAYARIPARQAKSVAEDGVWTARADLPGTALPTVMKKVCAAGFAALGMEGEAASGEGG